MSGTVPDMAHQLSGAEVPGGMDATSLKHFLLQYGDSIAELRHIVASIMHWHGNYRPPWAKYWALIAVRLVGADK